MDSMEIEVKFFLTDIADTRNKILELGAESMGKFHETNIRFEDRQNSLRRRNALLRLRMDDRARLTYKSEPEVKDPNFKVYRELEVVVDDFETMETILNSLGFINAQKYEKHRETMRLGDARFCLDQMPFGDFLEIEAPGDVILKMADALGMRWEDRILHNYLKMFEMIKKAENLTFDDLTFENFENEPVDFSKHVSTFTVKKSTRSLDD
jgi:adenylate cyclase class 2